MTSKVVQTAVSKEASKVPHTKAHTMVEPMWIKAVEPCLVWIRSILAKVFFDFDLHF